MADTTAHRVKITDPVHLYLMGFSTGLAEAADLLEKLPATVRGTPGVALALATVLAEANAQRGKLSTKNIVAVARAGLPIAEFKTITFDPNKAELVCEFYEPDLFDSAADRGGDGNG